jgi:hypothetical protein
MKLINRTTKQILFNTFLIFAASFVWHYFTRDAVYEALKSGFAVSLIALLAWSAAEIAFWYQTK